MSMISSVMTARRPPRLLRLLSCAALAAGLAAGAPVRAQPAPPGGEPSGDRPVSNVADELASLRPGTSPVLREGSLLVDARGTLRRDEATRLWVFRIDVDDAADAADAADAIDLTVLPGAVLREMIDLHEIAEDRPVAFELTGRVLVYRGRGYVLPSHAPQITDVPPPADAEAATDPPAAGDAGAAPAPEGDDDDSVQSILRSLQTAVGPVMRAPGRMSTRGGDNDDARLVPEGTMIVARRGRLMRTAGGAWMFVFDSDASGLGDPPMTVLPCLLLERMENHAQSRGGEAAMLLSGRVLAFDGRNFIMPSVFQIPRERSQITP